MNVVAIIAAGGRGERLGTALPKQLLDLGGRTILQRSVDAFDASDRVHELVVVVPRELVRAAAGALVQASKPLQIVEGGPRRQDSVANGFRHVQPDADIVVIHDAARPLVTGALIARTVEAAIEAGAAVAALPAHDTVKQAAAKPTGQRSASPAAVPGGATSEGLWVERTLPRELIYFAQTPQAFRRDVLREAIALGQTGVEATDEAMLAELAGHRVRLVEGDPQNIKITTELDLAWARAREGIMPTVALTRVGVGYDLHRLVDGRSLVLGGVRVPFERGLAGHSDADTVCHAVTDAILGAAAAGNIGEHFPDTDERWKNASSLDLLRRATAVVRERGFVVENLDVVVVAERPTLGPYVGPMRMALAEAIGIHPASISIKGKTNDGVGELGRGEAIAAHAVALVKRTR